MTIYDERLRSNKEGFEKWTKAHAITSLDEGAGMRRLVIQKPGTWAYGYTITTWPNYLAITGDLGSYVFTRMPDMFEFFRTSGISPRSGINPGYWAEKVCAADKNGTEEFDIETLRQSLRENFEGSPQLEVALAAIADLGDQDERDAVEALLDIDQEAYDLSRTQFTHQFLTCLRAIVLAIRLYDEHKESMRLMHKGE